MVQRSPQAMKRPMQARLHRARPSAHAGSDLFDAHVSIEAKGEYYALIGRQLGQCRPEQTPVVCWTVIVACGGSLVDGEVVALPSRNLAETIAARVDEDAIEPVFEEVRIAQRRPVAPSSDECVVGGVLGFGALAEDCVRKAIACVEVAVGKRMERRGAIGIGLASRKLPVRHGLDLTRSHCIHDNWAR